MTRVSKAANPDIGEGTITVLVGAYDSVVQGTWSRVSSYGGPGALCLAASSTSGADGDKINLKVYLAAGTYKCYAHWATGTNRPIVELKVDTVSKGTIDCYFGSSGYIIDAYSDIVITTDGIHDISVEANGKNASSSSYLMFLGEIYLYRSS